MCFRMHLYKRERSAMRNGKLVELDALRNGHSRKCSQNNGFDGNGRFFGTDLLPYDSIALAHTCDQQISMTTSDAPS
jgi:hypothetical protein